MFGGYPPTAIGYPPTAIGYPPTAIGYPPAAIGYPPAAIIGRIGHSEFFLFYFIMATPARHSYLGGLHFCSCVRVCVCVCVPLFWTGPLVQRPTPP